MRRRNTRQRARGYLREIPVAVSIALIAVAALMDHVGVTGKKVLVGVDGLALLALFYYFILAPGWRPGSASNTRVVLRWTLFGVLALLLIGGVAGFAVVYDGR